MNRRKMFGILAAPVAAANIPVQSEIKTKLKPYSAFDYRRIMPAWAEEYYRRHFCVRSANGRVAVRETDGVICSHAVFNIGRDLHDDELGVIYGHPDGCKDGMGALMRQAFADACLNGEVPGVWWE